jgi:hypothetical protein
MQWEIENHQFKIQKYFVITHPFFGLPGPSFLKLMLSFLDKRGEECAHSEDLPRDSGEFFRIPENVTEGMCAHNYLESQEGQGVCRGRTIYWKQIYVSRGIYITCIRLFPLLE